MNIKHLLKLVIILTSTLLLLSGCSTAHIIAYDSFVGESGAIPARPNISVTFNDEQLPSSLQSTRSKESIINAIRMDLEENIFSTSGEELSVQVQIDAFDATSKRLLGQWIADAGFGLWALGSLAENPLDMVVGSVALTVSVFLPRMEDQVHANVNLALQGDERAIGHYRATGTATNKRWWFMMQSEERDIWSESLQNALEDIKTNILADKENLSLALQLDTRGAQQIGVSSRFSSESVSSPNKVNIAVLDLDAIGISESEGQALSQRLRFELLKVGRFIVLERQKVQEILREQGFQETGCTSTVCLIEVGRLLNMEQMIAGSVARVGDVFSVQIRMVDVGTGEISKEIVVDLRGSISDVLTEGMMNAASQLAF